MPANGRRDLIRRLKVKVQSRHFSGMFRKGYLRTATQPGHLEYRMRSLTAAQPLSVLDSNLNLTVGWPDRL